MVRTEREFHDEIERRIYETIISFPGRLDEMETRSEDNCHLLARRIADLVRQRERTGPVDAA